MFLIFTQIYPLISKKKTTTMFGENSEFNFDKKINKIKISAGNILAETLCRQNFWV